jgi:uncharacterized protein YjbI with pentapeptide repeats
MCDYKSKYFDDSFRGEKKCPYRVLEHKDHTGNTFCIFHSKMKDKGVFFYQEFKKLYSEKSGHKFPGFVFPGNFNFQRLREETGSLVFINAIFAYASFLCDVDLREARFIGDRSTLFECAEFISKDSICFEGVVFKGKGWTSFDGALFSGTGVTSFRDAKFLSAQGTYFIGTRFSSDGGTSFERARFKTKTEISFRESQFSGNGGVYFDLATFLGDGYVTYHGTQFSNKKEILFVGTEFIGKGNNARIDSQYTGKEITDLNRMIQYSGNASAFLTNIKFNNPENVVFDAVDLSRVRFLWTDLRKINFKQVNWTSIGNKLRITTKLLGDDRFAVFDECFQRRCSEEGEDFFYDVQQLYDQLRLNYEETGRYHEAGDFFVGAMEMRRRGTKEKKTIRIVMYPYKLISLYGERPIRAFILLTLMPFLFTPLYLLSGLRLVQKAGVPGYSINYDNSILKVFWQFLETMTYEVLHFTCLDVGFINDIAQTLLYSLSNLVLGKVYTDLIPENGFTVFLTFIENALGITLLSLFLLSVNRKFRRTED